MYVSIQKALTTRGTNLLFYIPTFLVLKKGGMPTIKGIHPGGGHCDLLCLKEKAGSVWHDLSQK